jgi:nucleotide-binding universal stress UspA family protein
MTESAPILVPLDGSEFSEQAIPLAASMAERWHAPLRLVHVHVTLPWEVHCADGLVVMDNERDHAARAHDAEYLDRRRATSGVAETEAAVIDGPGVSTALAAEVERSGARLVVMATHGRGGVPRFLYGSVTADLVKDGFAPVLVVHPAQHDGATAFERVLIPLDGSVLARSILGAVSEVAAPGARVVLITVVEPRDAAYWRDATGTPPPDEKEQQAAARRWLEDEAAPLRAQGFDVETWVARSSHCAEAILAAAGEMDAQLIALGTHGRSGIARAALGSIAEQVVRGSHVPLLLQHPRLGSGGSQAGREGRAS